MRPGEFRAMGSAVEKLKAIRKDWNARQENLQILGLTKKKSESLKLEKNKITILAKLKEDGGPFTSAEEVDTYMDNLNDKRAGQSRMRDELTFARDSSRSIPRTSPFFRIMIKDIGTGKRRLKTATEFAEALKILLGKQTLRR